MNVIEYYGVGFNHMKKESKVLTLIYKILMISRKKKHLYWYIKSIKK